MRTLGRYELLEPIGEGGMATVHLGRARGAHGFERLVAVKICHPFLRRDEAFVGRFLEEARLAARIRHPNVVPTIDVGEEGDDLYLVMEWIEGDRLSKLIARGMSEGARIPPAIVVRIVADTLAGLSAAHTLADEAGAPLSIVHRDVSPHNVLVGVDGAARIADFGLAKALAKSAVSRDGELRGKLAYMAPEQLLAMDITAQVDVFAAGVVLWEALTGERLFAGETDAETINLVLRREVPPPSSIVPGLPPALDAVVERALARDPAQRWADAHEMQLALEAALPPAHARAVGEFVRASIGRPLRSVSDTAAPTAQPKQPRARKRAPWLPVAVALSLFAVLGAAWALRARESVAKDAAAAQTAPSDMQTMAAKAPLSASVAPVESQSGAPPAESVAPVATAAHPATKKGVAVGPAIKSVHPSPAVTSSPEKPAAQETKAAAKGSVGYWPKEP